MWVVADADVGDARQRHKREKYHTHPYVFDWRVTEMRSSPYLLALAAMLLASAGSAAGSYSVGFSDYQTFTITPTLTVPYHNMIQFDLNTLDLNDDQYNKPYQATFVGMVLGFQSPVQYAKRENTTGYRGIPAPWWAFGQIWYERDRYTIYEDATRDTVEVALRFEDEWRTYTRAVQYHENDVLGNRIDEGAIVIEEMGWTVIHRRFTQEHTTHKGWYGDLEFALISMPGSPALFNDGVLNVYYNWAAGQGILTDAFVLANIEPNPLPPTPSVPVPSSILLTCTGLACLRLSASSKSARMSNSG